jgi:hypothetical protein
LHAIIPRRRAHRRGRHALCREGEGEVAASRSTTPTANLKACGGGMAWPAWLAWDPRDSGQGAPGMRLLYACTACTYVVADPGNHEGIIAWASGFVGVYTYYYIKGYC